MSHKLSIASLLEVQSLEPRFRTEKVEVSDNQSFSDSELSRLDVTTIGDRVRLRLNVAEFIQIAEVEHPIPKRLVQNRIRSTAV